MLFQGARLVKRQKSLLETLTKIGFIIKEIMILGTLRLLILSESITKMLGIIKWKQIALLMMFIIPTLNPDLNKLQSQRTEYTSDVSKMN